MTDQTNDRRDHDGAPDGANTHRDGAPPGKPVGKGEGGADASGAGNILAGVQPEQPGDEEGEERRED